jgi:hypothetical protein
MSDLEKKNLIWWKPSNYCSEVHSSLYAGQYCDDQKISLEVDKFKYFSTPKYKNTENVQTDVRKYCDGENN